MAPFAPPCSSAPGRCSRSLGAALARVARPAGLRLVATTTVEAAPAYLRARPRRRRRLPRARSRLRRLADHARAVRARCPTLWGGGELAVFRAAARARACWPASRSGSCSSAQPARAAAPAARAGRHRRWSSCAANPITLRALDDRPSRGAAGRRRCARAPCSPRCRRALDARRRSCSGWRVANKAWAVLAVGPVLLALPGRSPARAGDRRRHRDAPSCCRCCWPGSSSATPPAAAAGTGAIFQPWQVWWFLGSTGEVIRGADGLVKEGYRAAPGWVSPISHPLIVALGAAAVRCSAWRRTRRPARCCWRSLLAAPLRRSTRGTPTTTRCRAILALRRHGRPLRYGRPPLLALA